MLRNLSPAHIMIVVVVLVVLFGWKRLPDMARSVNPMTGPTEQQRLAAEARVAAEAQVAEAEAKAAQARAEVERLRGESAR